MFKNSATAEFIKLKVDIRYNRLQNLQEELIDSREHVLY